MKELLQELAIAIGEEAVDSEAEPSDNYEIAATLRRIERAINEVANKQNGAPTFQTEVAQWMLKCFTAEIAADKTERNHRFLEEALELVQSIGCTSSEAHQLVDYVYGRDVGEPSQEVGGVMVTLAALCLANNMSMAASGYVELERINDSETVLKIREKQAAKPKHSPLPISTGPNA